MAVGSSMLATIRTAPPQWMQVVTSMPNTRLRRCAQVIERRRSPGVRGSVESGGLSSATFEGSRLPRPEGVSCARNFAFGAKTPWNRVRCARGGGTRAASLAMKSKGCRRDHPAECRHPSPAAPDPGQHHCARHPLSGAAHGRGESLATFQLPRPLARAHLARPWIVCPPSNWGQAARFARQRKSRPCARLSSPLLLIECGLLSAPAAGHVWSVRPATGARPGWGRVRGTS